MKKVLITGKNSYIGQSFKSYVEANYPSEIQVDSISVRGDAWREYDFSRYDAVLHVAGIAHVSADPKMETEYYKVNRDLTIAVAKLTKQSGVRQFVFMSSMIIYGEKRGIDSLTIIDRATKPEPIDFYGRSKLEADLGVQKLADDKFNVVSVRTPMVFGPQSKGNFPLLVKVAKVSPIFPKINNQRSMIYINNLAEFLAKTILNNISGIYFPQNQEPLSTLAIVKIIRTQLHKPLIVISLFNPLLRLLGRRFRVIDKVFGSKTYQQDSSIPFNYLVVDNAESIRRSVEHS
ncbi:MULTISPECIES: NAD-dependent epimerase/dehydratase family protein [Lactobacillaceae]|jgi:UDP-glucose 4-epimerase|uniref:NAD-dependent epimerase/dehydratase family protein n=1 Tax=Lactobacillaceae TaxID=33958 RepID=UPI000933738D|nr:MULTISPECIES: NAD-dependent epimerase/dehydratase family protein [Lactobacillaceae]MBU7449303.1 NAD-dependent epimerase/dehydratase family protein [Lactiplantibacillus sp. 7.2.4]MBU7472228.1 NAD-dependent epimerase/dehydratase family protein [Lactiplantibacillus plantarum]MCI1977982.1 NAD-dependent epimerase/dehydratase family protein [Liquorilactobacillus nagelii]MCS8602751.1 NAD-dependent epimerase/dehydratase family protein [Lactiplantibacillus pentosus]